MHSCMLEEELKALDYQTLINNLEELCVDGGQLFIEE